MKYRVMIEHGWSITAQGRNRAGFRARAPLPNRELECRIPRLHSPVSSRKFPEPVPRNSGTLLRAPAPGLQRPGELRHPQAPVRAEGATVLDEELAAGHASLARGRDGCLSIVTHSAKGCANIMKVLSRRNRQHVTARFHPALCYQTFCASRQPSCAFRQHPWNECSAIRSLNITFKGNRVKQSLT